MNLHTFYTGRAIGFVIVVVLIAIIWLVSPWLHPSDTPTPTQVPGINEPVAYVSQRLGVAFKYVPRTGSSDFDVWEDGNRIYVYVAGTNPKAGQFVEVFDKRLDETFEQSIRRQILADYPSPDCTVEISYSTLPVATIAQIGYPAPANSEEPHWANAEQCNADYAKSNGIRYFRYDEAHPDRFVYLDIGQYSIPGTRGGSLPWEDTLRITAR